ncbi:MAG: ankyrin repeat domain-containing protein, partial [Planctomycetales bacterium]|nr:ankyrin repeat domain-containing protein [Planctomycetales bacterium]
MTTFSDTNQDSQRDAMATLSRIALIAVAIAVLAGCGDSVTGTFSGKSFHAKFGWKPEDFFTDPQVIALCKAIEANDLAETDRLVASGVDVNATGEGNMTPLMWAFPDSHLPRFQRLLDHGADPNVVVTTNLNAPGAISVGDSVMHLCARTHFPGYFEAALRAGGDPNLKDGKGNTVLHAIIKTGVPDASNRIALAIDSGGEIDAYGAGGDTPLLTAISWFGQFDIALLLLERGADPTVYQKDQLPNAIHLVLLEER